MRWLRVLVLLFVASCTMGPPPARNYVVFFEISSATLDETSQEGLADLAKLALRYPSMRVVVTGYADPTGTSDFNVALSKRRADAVAAALVADGIPAARIAREGRGPTGDPGFAAGIASRRVEVLVAPAGP